MSVVCCKSECHSVGPSHGLSWLCIKISPVPSNFLTTETQNHYGSSTIGNYKSLQSAKHLGKWVGLLNLRVSLFYSWLVVVAYGQLAWSFLLTVERFGLFCLRWKVGLVFLLTIPPVRKSFFLPTVSPVRKLGLVFFA